MAEINGIKACRPEKDIMLQFIKCEEELGELGEAIEIYKGGGASKEKAEIAFETMDTITALTTLVHMLFNDEEIRAAVEYTNAKNRVRGYRYD